MLIGNEERKNVKTATYFPFPKFLLSLRLFNKFNKGGESLALSIKHICNYLIFILTFVKFRFQKIIDIKYKWIYLLLTTFKGIGSY